MLPMNRLSYDLKVTFSILVVYGLPSMISRTFGRKIDGSKIGYFLTIPHRPSGDRINNLFA